MTADEETPYPYVIAAQQATNTCLLNGIGLLIAGLRGKGLLDDGQICVLHTEMTKPFQAADLVNNPVAELSQNTLDELFAALRTV